MFVRHRRHDSGSAERGSAERGTPHALDGQQCITVRLTQRNFSRSGGQATRVHEAAVSFHRWLRVIQRLLPG